MKSFRCHEVEVRPDECIDEFLNGRLRLIQSKDGYRFSIDAILLSEFVTIRKGDVIVDLGTGCGVILLMLLLTKSTGHTIGLEIQQGLADQAARNAILNGFENKMDVVIGDIKYHPLSRESADVVICNPPYRRAKSGRINPDVRRAIARHELLASLDDILRAARGLLRKKGRLALIYPSARLADILVRLKHYDFEPKRLRINYPDLKSNAKLTLIEASLHGKPGLEIGPPLLGQGKFSISALP